MFISGLHSPTLNNKHCYTFALFYVRKNIIVIVLLTARVEQTRMLMFVNRIIPTLKHFIRYNLRVGARRVGRQRGATEIRN